MKSYAIISVGGKQYRVQEGDRLFVERLPQEADKTFNPSVLMLGGDDVDLAPSGAQVTARVVEHSLGKKIRIGKYRRRTGYRRHTGHRSKLTQIQIEAISTSRSARSKREPAAEAPADDRVKGMPSGYEDMTVAEVSEGAKSWNMPMLEAALAYEQAHAKRKGAVSALEHAIELKEEND